MSTLRSYGERCAAARALDLVGQRWALLVVRELLLGPKRFTDLRDGMPKAKPSVLSQRLRELEEGGVIRRRKLGPPARATVYELTEVGRGLETVLISLGRWGRMLPVASGTVRNTDALVLALKWAFEADRAGDLVGRYELRLGGDCFGIVVEAGALEVRRGEEPGADAVIETDALTLEAVVFDGQPARAAERDGRLAIRGDHALALRFFRHYRGARPTRNAA